MSYRLAHRQDSHAGIHAFEDCGPASRSFCFSSPAKAVRNANNLWNIYVDRFKGDCAQNIELSIDAFRSALTVRHAGPDFAHTQQNLGIAYAHRIKGIDEPTFNSQSSACDTLVQSGQARTDGDLVQHHLIAAAYRAGS